MELMMESSLRWAVNSVFKDSFDIWLCSQTINVYHSYHFWKIADSLNSAFCKLIRNRSIYMHYQSKVYKCFEKSPAHAHQGCIYLIKLQ